MAGYTRQDTANNIANGNVIDADDFDSEYNAIEAAFNSASGHTHDGTSGEGAPITVVGPAQDIVVSGTKVEAKTHNTYDLGSNEVRYKDIFLEGVLDANGTLDVAGNTTLGGTLAVTGVITATGGVTGDVTGNITGDVTGTVSDISNHSTTDLSEGTNLYYTDTRARAAISAGEGIDFSAEGVISGEIATTTNKGIASFNSTDFSVSSGQVSLNKDPVITLTGDVTGSGTMTNLGSVSITTTVGNDSHTHSAENITGLPTYINNVVGDMVTGNSESGLSVTYRAVDGTLDFALTNDPTITLTGDVTGSGTMTNLGNVSIAATVQPNSVALGTDTTGDYVESLVEGTGVTIANNSGEGATPTISIGQAVSTNSNVMFNDVVVSGDLTVSGTTTTVNTETVNLADNIILLNSNETGTPTQDGGIEIERGTATNKKLVWDESEDEWTIGSDRFKAGAFEGTLVGNAYTASQLVNQPTIYLGNHLSGSASFNGSEDITINATVEDNSHDHTTGNITGLAEYIADTVGDMVTGNSESGISVTYQDTDNTLDFALTRDPTITLTGAITGSGTMTNLGDVSIDTTVDHNHDGRYYTETEANSRFVNASGDTITGTITFQDSKLCRFGSGGDFEIFHNGSHAYMDMVTGNLYIRDGSSTRFTFDDAGHFTASGNITAYSDERLKSDIITIPNALEKVKALRGVNFTKDGEASTGVIAQEVQKVVPEVVQENDEYLSVAYGNLVGVLIEAVKELSEEVEALKAK